MLLGPNKISFAKMLQREGVSNEIEGIGSLAGQREALLAQKFGCIGTGAIEQW